MVNILLRAAFVLSLATLAMVLEPPVFDITLP